MKYKIRTDLMIDYYGVTLYRIEALKDFNNVKAGDLGGYVEKEDNLGQEGLCWIYYEAKVYNNARVFDNAQVYGYAQVYGCAQVCGYAWVYDDAKVFGDSQITHNTTINNSMKISSSKDFKYLQGPKHDITVTLQGVNIGCKHYKDYEKFLEKSPKDGKDNDYTELDMKYLNCLIKNTIKFMKLSRGV